MHKMCMVQNTQQRRTWTSRHFLSSLFSTTEGSHLLRFCKGARWLCTGARRCIENVLMHFVHIDDSGVTSLGNVLGFPITIKPSPSVISAYALGKWTITSYLRFLPLSLKMDTVRNEYGIDTATMPGTLEMFRGVPRCAKTSVSSFVVIRCSLNTSF